MTYTFIDRKNGSIPQDILSGLTVALALVPEAVAFAFVAGISPIIGLYGAFMMGLVTSLIGGRPGMISGATGAMAVVMVSLIREGTLQGNSLLGLQYLFATLILAGFLQIAAGGFKLGKFVRMIPSPVMLGFVNGLAIVIFLSQLGMFKQGDQWLPQNRMLIMVGLTALTMFIMAILPKLAKQIPAALSAILIVSIIVIFGKIDTQTVGSFIEAGGGSGLKAGLPRFSFPHLPFSIHTLSLLFPYAFILAAIGLIESLMTLNLIDELTNSRGRANQECIAQGVANIVNGFFGGMGGCAMIGQSIINIKSGGRGRLSGLTAAIGLLVFILFGASIIEQIPIAALVGVMFMVVIGTFAWNTFKILNKVPLTDVIVMLIVTGMTVAFDLAIAVFSGVVISALVFSWENAIRIRARKRIDSAGTKHYEIYGPLFFGSTTAFLSKFDVATDPDQVTIDFQESRIMDQSAIESINKLAERYQQAGKKIQLKHLSADCAKLINKARKICDVNVLEDPDYFVAVDNYKKLLGSTLGADITKLDQHRVEDLANNLAHAGKRFNRPDDLENTNTIPPPPA